MQQSGCFYGLVKMKSGLPRFSLSSEDKAIDLRVIATGIE